MLSLLAQSTAVACSSVETQDVLRFLIEGVAGLLPGARVTISLIDENATFFLAQQEDGTVVLSHCHPMAACQALYNGFVGGERPTSGTQWTMDMMQHTVETPSGTLVPEVHIPLLAGQELLGILNVEGWDTGSAGAQHTLLFQQLVNISALALWNRRIVSRYRQSEQMYRELVENASDLFFAVDTSGRLNTCNSRALQVLGFEVRELAGKSFLELFSPHSAETIVNLLKCTLENKQSVGTAQVSMVNKSGKQIPVALSATALYREGRVVEWLAIARRASTARGTDAMVNSARDKLAVLNTIPVLLAHSLDHTVVLQPALDLVLQLITGDAGCFYLLDPTTSALNVVAHSGISQECIQGLDQVKIGECLVGRVAREGEALVVKSIEDDPTVSRVALKREGLRCGVAVPIKAKGKVLGVVSVFSRTYRYFTPEDTELLLAVGHQIGTAVENAQLYEKNRQQAQKLNQAVRHLESISGALSAITSGPHALSQAIVQALSQLIDAPIAGLILLEGEQSARLWSTPNWPSNLASDRELLTQGIVPMAFQKRSAVAVEDVLSEGDLAQSSRLSEAGIASGVCVPLFQEGNIIGALVAYYQAARSFDREDLRILQIFANQVAIALRNATLYLSERETVTRLNEMNQLVLSQKQSLEQSEAIHKQLTDVALRGKGVQGVADTLARLVENPVIVEDRFGRLVAQAPPAAEKWGRPPRQDDLEQGTLAQALGQMLGVRQAVFSAFGPEGGGRRYGIVAPIVAGEDFLGRMAVLQSCRELGEVDRRAVEHAATVMALEMMRQRTALEVEQRIKGDFLREALTTRHPNWAAIRERASYLGYDLAAVERVLIVSLDQRGSPGSWGARDIGLIASQDRTLLELVERSTLGRAYSTLVSDNVHSVVVVLVRKQAPPKVGRESNALRLAEKIKEEVRAYLTERTVSIGIGCPCREIEDLGRSYREARQSLQLLWSLYGKDQIVSFEDLGVIRLLLDAEGNTDLAEYAERMLAPVILYDRRHNSALLDTLEAYLSHDSNLLRTAQALFVHPSTLKYRLNKIRTLCNVDLSDSETKLNLHVGVKILRLKAAVTGHSTP
jgi:PAS domain S-box-containing protein